MEPSLRNLTDRDYGKPKERQHSHLQELTRPHVDSFNYMIKEGLNDAVKHIPPVEFSLPNGERVSLCLGDATINKPSVPKSNAYALNPLVYPAECRSGRKTYKGQLTVRLSWKLNDRLIGSDDFSVGEIPIMVKSVACNLHNMKPADLIEHGEEAEEMGGYFIVNGNEKVIRMLILQRGNYPMAMSRMSWKNRGPQYTEYGISVRCVASDQTSANLILHFLNNGTVNVCLFHNKQQFFIPVIIVLKALIDTSDQFIYSELIKGKEDDSFYKGCLANMLRQAQEENLSTHKEILNYIGRTFRVTMSLPEWYKDSQITEYLLRECVCIHLKNNKDKFNLLVYMTRKLYSFAAGQCAMESPDNPMFQEVLLSGHLYQMVLKEKLGAWLLYLKTNILQKAKKKPTNFVLDHSIINHAVIHGLDIGKSLEYLMATGNLVSKTGLGLLQSTGLTVVADKLNFMRYVSHFRCVHRGAFFAQMRTTGVRKLLGEAWGFLCPVHTPDGPPCGLMNHMSATCHMVNQTYNTTRLPSLLFRYGVIPYDDEPPCPYKECYHVMLNGRMVGWLPHSISPPVVEQLRMMKVKGLENVPRHMEICLVKKTPVSSQYPGLMLFTGVARMMRPVKNLAYDTVEMVGTFEQAYLDICITVEEAHEGITTHQELSEFSMLSAIASLTPFSDYNQSPRNMYQCQMGKQTMGSPLQAWQYRADNKLYRLQTPQSPLVRPYMHDYYHMDEYPVGTNAIVAVISYTGYDMEDAMILNKSSNERGFAHGSVYKSEFINLKNLSKGRGPCSLIFGCNPTDPCVVNGDLDIDGLPPIGAYLEDGKPYYSYVDLQTLQTKVVIYKSQESARVDNIKIVGHDNGNEHLSHVCIVLRIQRNPIIGDKFSSRHGQKGICSQKWPVEDMPFSETGMTPDIIFNPHGFPSRMTIGMMIESMAGKSAASHGLVHDATPFSYTEDDPPIAYFGKMLTAAGYNYFGTERMYSGVDGREFEADIFIGVVYYQRLRHMVSDKFQVRTTGPVDQISRQPLKGRKRGGGIRFGEMERDALLAHGTSFLLHDRLLNCSDESKAYVCVKCGCILSPVLEKPHSATAAASREVPRKWSCLLCKCNNTVHLVRLPYVFRYLVAELASVNIKVTLDVKQTT